MSKVPNPEHDINIVDDLAKRLDASFERIARRAFEDLLKERQLKDLLTIEDVAKALKVSKRTAETIVARGELPYLPIQGQRRFAPDTVAVYVASRRGAELARRGRKAGRVTP